MTRQFWKEVIFSVMILTILLLTMRVVSRDTTPVLRPQQEEVDRLNKGDRTGD